MIMEAMKLRNLEGEVSHYLTEEVQ